MLALRARLFVLLIATAVLVPLSASAQLDSTLTIVSSVSSPQPGESVTLTLESSTLDLQSNTITWRRAGQVLSQGEGETRVEITLGALGESSTITASVGSGETASITLTPAHVSILWESNAYTPTSYRGRSLPSAGTRIRLWALPSIPRAGGGVYAPDQLTYTWKLNGATVPGISGRGKSSATIGSPELFGSYVVSVEASAGGGARGVGSVRIASREPVVRLYADHPLFGVQYWSAIVRNAFVTEKEMTFVAIPYFAEVTHPDDGLLTYAWRIDRESITPDPIRPSAITLRAGDNGALALVSLLLTHASNFLMETRGTWQMTLGVGAEAGIFDPFRTIQ